MSILIVEDNQVSAKIIEVHLQKNDYETMVAPTAKRALEYLMSSSHIELIISDIVMPEMDGLQLLGKIKERPEWRDIPVIMCSSLADLETVKKAVKAGCRNYLIKPIERRDLLKKVHDALKQNRAVLSNKKEVITRLGLNEETYEEVVGAFFSMVSDKIIQLEKQMVGGTESEMGAGISQLHENAIYFGADRLKDVVEKLSSSERHIETEIGDSEHLLLIKELRLVQNALEQHKSRAKTREIPKLKKSRSPKKSKKPPGNREKR